MAVNEEMRRAHAKIIFSDGARFTHRYEIRRTIWLMLVGFLGFIEKWKRTSSCSARLLMGLQLRSLDGSTRELCSKLFANSATPAGSRHICYRERTRQYFLQISMSRSTRGAVVGGRWSVARAVVRKRVAQGESASPGSIPRPVASPRSGRQPEPSRGCRKSVRCLTAPLNTHQWPLPTDR